MEWRGFFSVMDESPKHSSGYSKGPWEAPVLGARSVRAYVPLR